MRKLSIGDIAIIQANSGTAVAVGCCCICLVLLIAFGGSLTMISFGSTCIDTGIYTLCNTNAGAICLIIFGILICCCFVGICIICSIRGANNDDDAMITIA